MEIIGIYKITSPSNKIYIGQSINIKKRFRNYKSLSNCKNQTRLYSSFKKYGVENHIFEILEECTVLELNEKERYYQELYNCLNKKGLNCKYVSTLHLRAVLSEGTKKKLSDIRKGTKHTDKSKMLVSKNNAKYWLGKKRNELTKEQKLKISKSNTGKKRDEASKIKISEAVSKILLSENGIFYTYKEASFVYDKKITTLRAMILGKNKNKKNLILTKK